MTELGTTSHHRLPKPTEIPQSSDPNVLFLMPTVTSTEWLSDDDEKIAMTLVISRLLPTPTAGAASTSGSRR